MRWLGPLLSVYFKWVSTYGSCPLAEFKGVDEGGCRTFQGVKRAVLVSLSKFCLKWVTAEAFAIFFMVLSWKQRKNVRRYLTHFQSSLYIPAIKILKLCQLMCCFRIVNPHPQVRILVPFRGSFQKVLYLACYGLLWGIGCAHGLELGIF